MVAACRSAAVVFALAALPALGSGLCPEFNRALDLARAGQRNDARAILLGCAAADPNQPRYLVELAGLAYLDSDAAQARRYLHRALRLDTRNAYASEFLGTLYFFQRNLPAALKYWNRAGKPLIASVTLPPRLPVQPLVLPPRAQLTLDQFRATQDRLDALRLSPAPVTLDARPGGDYDLHLVTPTAGPWLAAVRSLNGLAWQSLTPDWRDIGHSGVSWNGLFRWDAQKRRVANVVTVPVSADAKWRVDLAADLRRETWNVGAPEDFRLESAAASAAIGAVESGRFQWSTGLNWSTRTFTNAPDLDSGDTLESLTRARLVLADRPESRFRLAGYGDAAAGRFFAGAPSGSSAYARLAATIDARWNPRAIPRSDELLLRFSSGTIQGRVPLDQRFILGVERDTSLWLRALPATRSGRKGSGLIGNDYALLNAQYDFELFRAPFVSVSAGPFLDSGRIGGGAWQAGAGAQLRVALLGRVSLVLSWGADLRTGRGVWYVSNGLPAPGVR